MLPKRPFDILLSLLFTDPVHAQETDDSPPLKSEDVALEKAEQAVIEARLEARAKTLRPGSQASPLNVAPQNRSPS